jgi:hypothetical protein
MGYDTCNVKATIMLWIWIGEFAGHPPSVTYVTITELGIKCRARGIPKLAKRFMSWDLKEMSSTKNVNSCDNWVERSLRLMPIFANGEVIFAFVKTKANVKLADLV